MYSTKENHWLVRYEELVTDPSEVLLSVWQFLGVLYEGSMLSDYRSAAPRLITEGEVWKTSVREPMRSRKGSKFESLFSEEERRYILDSLGDQLAANG
jgi:hypothetical protein